MKIQTLVIGAAAMLLSGSAYGTQLLTNPSFESGLFSPWTNDNTAQLGSWAVINLGCNTGNCAMIGNVDVGAEQTFAATPVGLITAVNFWATSVNSITVALLYQGGGTDSFFYSPIGWTHIDLMSHLRSTGSLIGIEVFGNSAAGSTAKIDDFDISATVPEPGAFWLLFAGLSTVGALARKKRSSRKS